MHSSRLDRFISVVCWSFFWFIGWSSLLICLSVRLFMHLFVCPSLCLSVHLFVRLLVSVNQSSWSAVVVLWFGCRLFLLLSVLLFVSFCPVLVFFFVVIRLFLWECLVALMDFGANAAKAPLAPSSGPLHVGFHHDTNVFLIPFFPCSCSSACTPDPIFCPCCERKGFLLQLCWLILTLMVGENLVSNDIPPPTPLFVCFCSQIPSHCLSRNTSMVSVRGFSHSSAGSCGTSTSC